MESKHQGTPAGVPARSRRGHVRHDPLLHVPGLAHDTAVFGGCALDRCQGTGQRLRVVRGGDAPPGVALPELRRIPTTTTDPCNCSTTGKSQAGAEARRPPRQLKDGGRRLWPSLPPSLGPRSPRPTGHDWSIGRRVRRSRTIIRHASSRRSTGTPRPRQALRAEQEWRMSRPPFGFAARVRTKASSCARSRSRLRATGGTTSRSCATGRPAATSQPRVSREERRMWQR